MGRPVIYVLAGVNGAGKSSVGGHLLNRAGLAWYNPDTFARELQRLTACSQTDANIAAWNEGVRRLDKAIADHQSFAFETTLGGHAIPARLQAAARSHDVLIWLCGLSSPEQHIARVKARVAIGGHDIPEQKIRERWTNSIANLIGLMPHLTHLSVYDNSHDVAIGTAIPDPVLLLETTFTQLIWPLDTVHLQRTPDWAKPLLETALALRMP